MAIVIWVLAVLFRTNRVSTVIPIKYTKLASDLIITETNTEQVRIILEGRGSDFFKLIINKPEYRLNLSMAKFGTNQYRLIADEINISSPIAVKSITPEYLEIKTDYLDSNKVEISVPHRFDSQKGIYITNVVVTDNVTLLGPEAQLRFIKEVSTESLFVASYSASPIERKLGIVLPDAKLYSTRPDSVTIIASIEKEETKTIDNVVVKIIAPARKQISILPDSAQITVRGPASIIQQLQKGDIKVNLDLSENESGESTLPAQILLPHSVFLVKCEPPLFEIKIQ
jgi:YbbR domain-containing protein